MPQSHHTNNMNKHDVEEKTLETMPKKELCSLLQQAGEWDLSRLVAAIKRKGYTVNKGEIKPFLKSIPEVRTTPGKDGMLFIELIGAPDNRYHPYRKQSSTTTSNSNSSTRRRDKFHYVRDRSSTSTACTSTTNKVPISKDETNLHPVVEQSELHKLTTKDKKECYVEGIGRIDRLKSYISSVSGTSDYLKLFSKMLLKSTVCNNRLESLHRTFFIQLEPEEFKLLNMKEVFGDIAKYYYDNSQEVLVLETEERFSMITCSEITLKIKDYLNTRDFEQKEHTKASLLLKLVYGSDLVLNFSSFEGIFGNLIGSRHSSHYSIEEAVQLFLPFVSLLVTAQSSNQSINVYSVVFSRLDKIICNRVDPLSSGISIMSRENALVVLKSVVEFMSGTQSFYRT
jgi:hypothetical protein